MNVKNGQNYNLEQQRCFYAGVGAFRTYFVVLARIFYHDSLKHIPFASLTKEVL